MHVIDTPTSYVNIYGEDIICVANTYRLTGTTPEIAFRDFCRAIKTNTIAIYDINSIDNNFVVRCAEINDIIINEFIFTREFYQNICVLIGRQEFRSFINSVFVSAIFVKNDIKYTISKVGCNIKLVTSAQYDI